MNRILYISIKNCVLIMNIISNDKPQLNRRIRKAINVNRPHAFWAISRSLTIGSNIMLLICVRGLVVIFSFSIFTLLPRVHHVRLLYCTFYRMKRTRHQFNPIQFIKIKDKRTLSIYSVKIPLQLEKLYWITQIIYQLQRSHIYWKYCVPKTYLKSVAIIKFTI